MRGLKEAGHRPELVILRDNNQPSYIKKSEGPRNSYPSETGGSVHLLSGWYGVPVMSYGTRERVGEFLRFARQFDYIIWDLPCPYKDGGPFDSYWRELYTSGVPQVAVIHDAHYERAYKHLDDVADYLAFIAPVNESARGALASFPGEVRLINNGHRILTDQEFDALPKWNQRKRQAVCAHVWKAWKRMDRVVAAAPYLERAHLIMGGDGIEGRYMRSKDKCKPKYEGMWQAFNESGAQWVGVLQPYELMALYANSRVMIDLSWNAKFAAYGCHYNRSIVEGANYGCVPLVCMESFYSTNVFKLGDYYPFVGVPNHATPDQLAMTIEYAMDLSAADYAEMIHALRFILKEEFDYRRTCLQYLAP